MARCPSLLQCPCPGSRSELSVLRARPPAASHCGVLLFLQMCCARGGPTGERGALPGNFRAAGRPELG